MDEPNSEWLEEEEDWRRRSSATAYENSWCLRIRFEGGAAAGEVVVGPEDQRVTVRDVVEVHRT